MHEQFKDKMNNNPKTVINITFYLLYLLESLFKSYYTFINEINFNIVHNIVCVKSHTVPPKINIVKETIE